MIFVPRRCSSSYGSTSYSPVPSEIQRKAPVPLLASDDFEMTSDVHIAMPKRSSSSAIMKSFITSSSEDYFQASACKRREVSSCSARFTRSCISSKYPITIFEFSAIEREQALIKLAFTGKLLVLVVTGANLNLICDHEGGVEADAELPNHIARPSP